MSKASRRRRCSGWSSPTSPSRTEPGEREARTRCRPPQGKAPAQAKRPTNGRGALSGMLVPARSWPGAQTWKGNRMGLLITDATIVTCDDQRSIHELTSLAVEDDRIVAIGRRADLEPLYPAFERFDAKGLAVLPGF